MFECRWADGRFERMPAAGRELVIPVLVLAATTGEPALMAAKVTT
jgi:hypothetical protein